MSCGHHWRGSRTITVVNHETQNNSCDYGVWMLYALYTRCLKKAAAQDPVRLFIDMDMKTPKDDTEFRCCHRLCSLFPVVQAHNVVTPHSPNAQFDVPLQPNHTNPCSPHPKTTDCCCPESKWHNTCSPHPSIQHCYSLQPTHC